MAAADPPDGLAQEVLALVAIDSLRDDSGVEVIDVSQ